MLLMCTFVRLWSQSSLLSHVPSAGYDFFTRGQYFPRYVDELRTVLCFTAILTGVVAQCAFVRHWITPVIDQK